MTDAEVSFLNDTFPCDCKIFSFCDPHHKHIYIVPDNLRFISNYKLRKLFLKSSKYCENKK